MMMMMMSFLINKFDLIKIFLPQQQYPESFIYHAKSKAIEINKHISYDKNNQPYSNIYPIKRRIILPENLIEKN